MKLFSAVLTIGITLATAAPALAQQGAPRDTARKSVPADARPPKGMCRIWIDGVPAAQQPAATDCPTAVKNRPENARVIFGDDFADSSKAKGGEKPKLPSETKGFTGVKTPLPQILPKRRPPEG